MEVILLEKIRNLGNVGDKVNVKAGYSRNFLIPTGKAVRASAANIAKFEAHRAELEKTAGETLMAAKNRAEKLSQVTVTLPVKASEEGKLFGSIGTREIAKAFSQAGQEVEKSEIILTEGAIRQIGEYPITLQLHSDVSITVIIKVVPEENA